jgi:hypothetical protein
VNDRHRPDLIDVFERYLREFSAAIDEEDFDKAERWASGAFAMVERSTELADRGIGWPVEGSSP